MNSQSVCNQGSEKIEPILMLKYLDVQEIPYREMENQRRRGDYIILNGDFCTKYLELKTEYKYTGNLYLEIYDDYPYRRPGWLQNLDQCDILVYHFLSNNQTIFINRFAELRQYVLHALENNRLYLHIGQNKYAQKTVPAGVLFPAENLKNFL